MSERHDEFYVGYLGRMPPGIGRFVTRVVIVLFLAVAGLAYAVPAWHRPGAAARSDFRDVREFVGIVLAKPAPQLVVPRPGARGTDAFSRYLLVGRGKSGPRIDVEALDGQWATVKGSLIYRGDQTLVSVKGAEVLETTPSGKPDLSGTSLGEFTLRGEIVDSKCHFGTMRPGDAKTHRGCAVRCIAGGIPPMLRVDAGSGHALYFLLVDREGAAVNQRVLPFVAQPVEITGEVTQLGDLFVLKAAPERFRRL